MKRLNVMSITISVASRQPLYIQAVKETRASRCVHIQHVHDMLTHPFHAEKPISCRDVVRPKLLVQKSKFLLWSLYDVSQYGI